MLGLELVLVTLHKQFVISIDKTNELGDTKYNI